MLQSSVVYKKSFREDLAVRLNFLCTLYGFSHHTLIIACEIFLNLPDNPQPTALVSKQDWSIAAEIKE